MKKITSPRNACRHSAALITGTVLLVRAGTTRAQDTTAPAAAAASAPEATTLPPVRVRAQADQETATRPVPGYTARRCATATKTDSVRIPGGYPDEYLDGLRKNFDYYFSPNAPSSQRQIGLYLQDQWRLSIAQAYRGFRPGPAPAAMRWPR